MRASITHLHGALELVRQARDLGTAETSLNNDNQRDAFRSIVTAVRNAYLAATSNASNDDELFSLLQLIHVADFSLGKSGSDRRAAAALLATALAPGADADAAFDVLATHANHLMAQRSSADARSWSKALMLAGLPVLAPASYRADVDKLRKYSQGVLAGLGHQQSISTGGRDVSIERECVPAVCKAIYEDHLLLIGEPGAGKSAVLAACAQSLAADEKDVVILAVDQLSGADLDGICGDLGISHPLLEVLDHWPGSEPIVLCIDALDASRGGPTERAVNALIEAVIARLSDRWRVLASIRTFDLKMGTRYRELFAGNAPATEFTELGLGDVRHILVTPWSDNELASLLSQAPLIAAVINTSPSALRELIRVPFNSRLLAALLDDGRPADSFAKVQGQADLLAAFWDRRVLPLGAGAHAALSKAIDLMIERRRLQARYIDLASHAGFPSTLHAAILVPVAEDRYITFRHHILFDYAVSRLLLDPFDLPALQATLSHQCGLGLLLAPALAYSLEALWRQDDSSRTAFWTLFLELAANKSIDPIARVVITRLGAELPHSSSDVAGLAQVISSGQDRVAAVSALVGGVLAATTGTRSAAPWKTLTATLATRAASYAGTCRSLLLWVLDTPEAEDDSKLATAARLLLQHALGRADYWRSLTISGIEATARTFAADPKASRQTLDRLFDPEHLARHAQDEMPWLCRHIARIYQHDPDFAADIYVRVFAHEGTDQTSTPMSQSQILSLSSNPRQDYRMAYWELAERFPKFLSFRPTSAITALIGALEGYVARAHPLEEAEPAKLLQISGQPVRLRTDYSHIWASDPENDTHEDAERLLAAFVKWLGAAGLAEASEAATQVISANSLALVWARCFMVASERNDALAQQLWPMASHPAFIHCNDTKKDAVDLVAVVLAQRPSAEQEAFLAGVQRQDFSIYREPDGARQSLLQRLRAAIRSRTAATVGATTPAPSDDDGSNARLVEFKITSKTPDDWWWISRAGVDISTDVHNSILEAAKSLETKLDKFKSDRQASQADRLAVAMESVSDQRAVAARAGAAQLVLDYADDNLCKSAVTLLQAPSDVLTDRARTISRKIALGTLKSPNPEPSPDAESAFERSSGWSSPAPRVEAAHALIVLARLPGELDPTLRRALECALTDPHPVVRHQVAIRLTALWDVDRPWLWALARKIVNEEKNRAVLSFFANYTLSRVVHAAPNETSKLLTSLSVRFNQDTSEAAEGLRDQIARLTALLAISHLDQEANARLQEWIAHAERFQRELTHALQQMREAFTLGLATGEPADQAIRQRSIALLAQIVDVCAQHLNHYTSSPQSAPPDLVAKAEASAKLLDTSCMQLLFSYEPSKTPNKHDRDAALRFLDETTAILGKIAEAGTPHTIHHLLDLLEKLVAAAPERVFDLVATALLKGGQTHGYAYESLAADQFTRLIGRFLADQKGIFATDERRALLIACIDSFIQAGWPSARRLLNDLPDLLR